MLNELYIWVILLILAASIFIARAFFILIAPRLALSAGASLGLSFIIPVTLTVLTISALYDYQGSVSLLLGKERALAAALAAIVAWSTKNLILTIGTGMGLLYAIKYLAML